MHRKMLSYFFALAFATGAFLAHAEIVGENTARAVAEGFLAKSSVAKTILFGRSVDSVESRGSLWIVRLAPSGYIEVAGSTKCAPVISFSEVDFVEPEVGSPFAAKLSADNSMVADKEADESAEENAGWAKYTTPVAKTRMLLGASPTQETSDAYVAPLMNAAWGQGAPFNDLSPLSSLCGCMATAAGQELRYWRWPYRYEKSRQKTHGLTNSKGEYSDHVIRVDGRVPFNYDKVLGSAPNPASTPNATDKEATYQTAFLSLWMQSLTGMGYKPGASGGTIKLCTEAEDYWFENGPVMSYWRDGYTNLWNAIRADLDFGSPIQVNSPGHQMVIDGYAIENEGSADEVDWININYGWGYSTGWVQLLNAVTDSTSGGRLADFQIGYRPQKIVQFEPVPKVSASSVTLTWHLPPCYTNKVNGFVIDVYTVVGEAESEAGSASLTVTQPNINTEFSKTINLASAGVSEGTKVKFTVTPVMSDSSAARSNSATTTIGTPKAAPEIVGVSSKACGIDLVQQGFYIECGRGIVNTIDVTCSESVTSLKTYSSHLTVLPDNKVTTVNNGNGSWTVNVDATTMAKDWDGDMLVLTLVAANDDGTEDAKNLMLRFNSMRNVLGGAFEIVETSATLPVWFAANTTTTLDAKGQNVTFGAGALCGTGTVVLSDSTGGGSFTFQGLGNFTGTLKWAPSVTVNLPADMSDFAGTLWLESYMGNYTLARNLPSTAKVYVAGNTQLSPGSVTIDAAVTGSGVISIAGVNATFNNLKGFTGSISLGTFDSSGTLTLRAGEEKSVEIWNGTLYLTLDKAQVAYGYSTSQINEIESFLGAKLIFQDENGNELKRWTSSLAEYTLGSSANTWFPDLNGTGSFSDEYRWSQGLPSAGDYVILNDNFGDSEMTLDLASDLNLGYVKVMGTKLQIVSGGTATLSVDTLENDVQTVIKTAQVQPTTVIPNAKLRLATGITLDCEIDSSIARNLRDQDDTTDAVTMDNLWHGTVVFTGAVSGVDLTLYGNAESTVRLNGVSGYLAFNKEIAVPVELVDDDATPALHWNSGSSGASTVVFDKLTGNGIFKTSGSYGTSGKVLLKDVSGFTGQFQLAAKTVAIAPEMPTENTGSNGRLHVCQAAAIAPGAIWNIGGGVYFGSGCVLDIYGELWSLSAAMTAYGEGAVVTLEDDAVIKVSAAMSGDYAPTLNFKAGTYQITANLRETRTVNFCAGTGKRTVIDANGNTLTLGPKFFSGSGDVYLTSSASNGKIVIEGISADYTGTIYSDISCDVSYGDLSKAANCTIAVTDIMLSRNSSDIGKLTIGSGATLVVTVVKDHLINGLTIDSVALDDGGTIVLQDKNGKVLANFTESDAVDGKYTLAPDTDVTVEYLLDYEFNGNMNSVGTDTTGLTIYNGSPSYNDAKTELNTKCTPYINKEFAMPADEWTAIVRCKMPANNSEKSTILIMFGVNGGNLFGLVSGTGENTVALASKTGLIGEAVEVENATSQHHVYAIVKRANRVQLYVDGELRIDESATVSVAKKFQIGSVHGGNHSIYDSCTDDTSSIDYFRFYDFAIGETIVEEEAEPKYTGAEPIVWVSGEFEDAASEHGGYSIVRPSSGISVSDGKLVVASDATTGAKIDLTSTNVNKVTVLIEYSSLAAVSGKNVTLATVKDSESHVIGARTTANGALTLTGYYDASSDNDYAFGTVPTVPVGTGYFMLMYDNTTDNNINDTYCYAGDSIDALVGGRRDNLKWTGGTRKINEVSIGGPIIATRVQAWSGVKIEKVALFVGEALTSADIAYYKFPEVQEPEEPEEPTVVARLVVNSATAGTYATLDEALNALAMQLFLNPTADVYVEIVDDELETPNEYGASNIGYSATERKYARAVAKLDNGTVTYPAFLNLADAWAAAGKGADTDIITVLSDPLDAVVVGAGQTIRVIAGKVDLSDNISFTAGLATSSWTLNDVTTYTARELNATVPGMNTNVGMTASDFALDSTGEWAQIVDKPIYLTLASPVRRFKLSFDVDIPDGVYGTLFSWDSTNSDKSVDSRVVVTNDASKMVIYRKNDGTLSTVGYSESTLITSGQHTITVQWVHNAGCTIYVDGNKCYSSSNLAFTNHDTTTLAIGGSALGSPDDVLAGLKVRNFTYIVYSDVVTRLDGTIYHGNDENRAVITNYLSQMEGHRPVKMPAPATVDLLLVYDTNAVNYALEHYATVEEHAAYSVAEMNRALTTTDIDTNVWFRIAGIYPITNAVESVDAAMELGKEGVAPGWELVHEVRDNVGADVVLSVVMTNCNYGLAYRCDPTGIKNKTEASWAYAGVRADAPWAWVHETGHLASLYHNIEEAKNNYIGCGFVKTAEADVAELRSLMDSGTAQFAFSSPNHKSHGEVYSVTNSIGNLVDASSVLAELLPYMAKYRDTVVNAWTITPQSGSTVTSGDTMTVACEDPEATIWISRDGLSETQYTGPVSIDTSSALCQYIVTFKKDGETVGTTYVAYTVDQPQTDSVAKIDGGNGYDTLQGAIDAAESGATIILLKSSSEAITLNKTIVFSEGENATFSGTFTGSGTLKLGAFLKNSKTPSGVSPLAAGWTGTVELTSAFAANGQNTPVARYGNANSTLKLTGGMTGGWLANVALDTTIELEGDMTLSDFSTSFANTIRKLTGTGTFSITYSTTPDLSYAGYYPYYLIKDVSGFEGSLVIPENVTIGIVVGTNSKPSDKSHGGKILVYTNVTASTGWTAPGGIVLADAEATLTVKDGATVNEPTTTVSDSYVKYSEGVYSVKAWMPNLPENPTSTDIEEKLEEVEFEDDSVSDMILGSENPSVEYSNFKTWAEGVAGGVAAVTESKYAAVSYLLGAEGLFEHAPAVKFETADIEAASCAMTVSITVKDGEDIRAVAKEKVEAMFEATSNLGDWNANKLTLDIDGHVKEDSSMEFTVTPVGDPPSAFLRIRKEW